MQNRRQAIIWINADSINWRIYAALGGGAGGGVKLMHDLLFRIEDIREMCVLDFKRNAKSWEGLEYKDPSYHFVQTDFSKNIYLANSVLFYHRQIAVEYVP